MIVRASERGFELTDRTDFSRFHVDATTVTAADFDAMLTGPVTTHTDSNHVWVEIGFLKADLDVVRDAVARDNLDTMLRYAGDKGWLSDDGSRISAHVVRS